MKQLASIPVRLTMMAPNRAVQNPSMTKPGAPRPRGTLLGVECVRFVGCIWIYEAGDIIGYLERQFVVE
jgi:hypothetical protein